MRPTMRSPATLTVAVNLRDERKVKIYEPYRGLFLSICVSLGCLGEIGIGDPIRSLHHMFLGNPSDLGCNDNDDANDNGELETFLRVIIVSEPAFGPLILNVRCFHYRARF